jgi:hypothetical protein
MPGSAIFPPLTGSSGRRWGHHREPIADRPMALPVTVDQI